jgi:hypothetical protein
MRIVVLAVMAALLAVPVAGARGSQPTPSWRAQASCVHRHEAPWKANTGNGYFGGMQFAAATWRRMHGSKDPALAHPGDPAYPFSATPTEQLALAWKLWLHDGRSWRSWGAVGAACAAATG